MTHRVYDAGHGGHNHGCRSALGFTREEYLTLHVGLQAQVLDPSIQLVRTGDETVSWAERAARAAGAGLVISGHYDSTPWAWKKGGTHAYYPRGAPMSKLLARQALKLTPQELRGGNAICAYDDPLKEKDNWKRCAEHVVETYWPASEAILLEFGYLSNQENLQFCRSTEGIQKCARLVVDLFDWYDGHQKHQTEQT